MSATGTGSKRKRVKIVQITVDGVEVDAKECTKCGEVKALSEYNVDVRRLGGTRSDCRECRNGYLRKHEVRESKRNWCKDNPEKKRGYDRAYRKANPERVRESKRKYREVNSEKEREYNRKYREANPEAERERKRNYRKANPEVVRASSQRYRALKLALPSEWTVDRELLVLAEFKEVCALSQSAEYLEIDHVIPLAWGHGGSCVGNMIPLFTTLNTSKSDCHFFEWFETNRQRFKLDQSRFDALTAILANQNGLTPDEYRQYVDWCFANKRSLDEIIADNKRYGYVVTSVELWRDSTGMQLPLRFDNREQTYEAEEVA